MISRYDDVLSVARDHLRFSNDPRWRNATPSVLAPAPDDYSILLVDPPEHTRLRKVAARVFTKPKLTALAPTIEALADDIVERAARRGHVEWVGEVAQPLAMRVMLRMLGIAGKEEARWQRWSANRARLLEMIATRSERKPAHITGESITRYFRELLAERARSKGDDAISTLAREAARGEFINTTEAADMLGVIMIAGNETTAKLIGNGLWALMRHPDQMVRLREEPDRARDAINEVLRYDSPVQTDFRIAKCEAVIGGKTIRLGEGVILLTGSANRDEAAFSEPDRLDIAPSRSMTADRSCIDSSAPSTTGPLISCSTRWNWHIRVPHPFWAASGCANRQSCRFGITRLAAPEVPLAQRARSVPRPRAHLTRYHGVFAPNFIHRHHIVPNRAHQAAREPHAPPPPMNWMQGLKRVFHIDIEHCGVCGGTLRVIACIETPEAIERLLAHLATRETGAIHDPRAPPLGVGAAQPRPAHH